MQRAADSHKVLGIPVPILAGAAFWLVVAGVAGLGLIRERHQAIESAKRHAEATVALMEQHSASTFQAVAMALEDVANRVDSRRIPPNDPAFREGMRRNLQRMPYVRAIYVIGPDGFILHDTDYPSTPHVSLADRPYFKAHEDDPQLVRGSSSPLQSRSGTGWFIAATRRVGSAAEFKGVAVAAIQLQYFSDLYQRIGLGAGQRILLFHKDGRLIADHPRAADRVGRTFTDFPLFQTFLPQSALGTYINEGPPLPYERIMSYRTVEGEPLVVALVNDMRVVLAGWYRVAIGAAVALSALLVLVIAGVGAYMREQTQRRAEREQHLQAEKLEALGQLTGTIAHDFANLLSIIGNNLDLMGMLLKDDTRTTKPLAIARRAVDNGSQMTHELLGFARQRELVLSNADLNEAVRAMQHMLQQAAGQRVLLELSLADEPCPCKIDRTQLEVALINLVVNARDAMKGRGRVELRTQMLRPLGGKKSRAGRTKVRLTVSDNGPGMSDYVRRRALEPFFTTKGEQGTGLGLAQVYGQIQKLGGDLVIESTEGVGTSIHMNFPSDAAAAEAQSASSRATASKVT
jgi:signal transduction histidine kinase